MTIKPISLSLAMGAALISLSLTGCMAPQASSPEEEPEEAIATDHSAHMTMDLGPANETLDLRFIDAMIPHHEGAVVMAQEALDKSSREEIRTLAQGIIDAQQTEIAQMQTWRQTWYPEAGPEPVMFHAEMNHDMPMSEDMKAAMMMSVDLGAADAEFDLRFLDAMIPHHEGALGMAQEVLEKSTRPEIQSLAEAILRSQQAEIEQMQQWKQDWYNQ